MTNTPAETVERLREFRDRLYSAMRSQEQDVIVNGANHPGLLEPMAGILRDRLDEFDGILAALTAPAPSASVAGEGVRFEASRQIAAAMKLYNRAFAAKQRAAWRTPGTATHLREHDKATDYRERAEAILDGVRQYLDRGI